MAAYLVRFKGMLTKSERQRLEQAGIRIEGREGSLQVGEVKTGLPIFRVRTVAATEEDALRQVREALDPDTGNFSGWEVGGA